MSVSDSNLNLDHFADKHGAKANGDGALPPGHPPFRKKKFMSSVTTAAFVKKVGG